MQGFGQTNTLERSRSFLAIIIVYKVAEMLLFAVRWLYVMVLYSAQVSTLVYKLSFSLTDSYFLLSLSSCYRKIRVNSSEEIAINSTAYFLHGFKNNDFYDYLKKIYQYNHPRLAWSQSICINT